MSFFSKVLPFIPPILPIIEPIGSTIGVGVGGVLPSVIPSIVPHPAPVADVAAGRAGFQPAADMGSAWESALKPLLHTRIGHAEVGSRIHERLEILGTDLNAAA